MELLEQEDEDESMSFSSGISFEENIIDEKEASTHSAGTTNNIRSVMRMRYNVKYVLLLI